jgi:hypothetical protein
MAQQTAVEWLVSNLNIIWEEKIIDLVEQAKQMEKQQMKDAVIYGLDEDGHTGDWKISVAENYYIKTYTK